MIAERARRRLGCEACRLVDRAIIAYDRHVRGLRLRDIPTDWQFDGEPMDATSFAARVASWLEDPGRFYRHVPQDHEATRQAQRQVEGVEVQQWALASPYASSFPESERILASLMRRPQRQSNGCIVMLVGWQRIDTAMEESLCHRLVLDGIDAVLVSAPYSQGRTPSGWHSGELFVNGDITGSVHHMRHCVADVRQVIGWLRGLGYEEISLFGFSVGGMVSALVTAVEPVHALFEVMSGADPAGIVWTSREARDLRRSIERQGVTQEMLRRLWGICDPAQVLSQARPKAGRIVFWRTLCDEVIRPEHQDAMVAALQPSRVIELPCAHYTVGWFLADIRKHLLAVLGGDP